MTDGRSGNGLGEEWPSFLPTTLREMVNLVGSLPSLRSRSGSRRRRALMNQLQIWENKYKNCRFQVWEEPIFSAYQPKRSVRQLTQTATFLHLNLYPSTTPSSGTASHMTRQGVSAPYSWQQWRFELKYAEPQRSQSKAFQWTDYITRNSAAASYWSANALSNAACLCMPTCWEGKRKRLPLMQQSKKKEGWEKCYSL